MQSYSFMKLLLPDGLNNETAVTSALKMKNTRAQVLLVLIKYL